MEWSKYTIKTTEEAEELVTAMLMEKGITGIEIEDKKPLSAEESGGLFGDVVPELPEDDHKARISFYLGEDDDEDYILDQVQAGLLELMAFMDIGEGTIEVSNTAEEDWINNWKEFFHSFRVDDIAIVPTWEEDAEPAKDAAMVLHIDPGTAFGTGSHESTQLAIRALRKYVKEGDRFLDVGTGSGILGIIALKSGAEHVFATDLDPNVIPAIADNLRQNDVREQDFEVILGNLIDDAAVQKAAGEECYEVAAANIIAEILSPLTAQIPAHLKKGGYYITSGILTTRADIVLEAARKAGLVPVETNHMGEWSSIVFQKQ